MKGRRYSENGPIPSLSIDKLVNTSYSNMSEQRRQNYALPKDGLAKLSPTSDAGKCFVYRAYSKKMQKLALSYSYNIVTTTVLSGEL